MSNDDADTCSCLRGRGISHWLCVAYFPCADINYFFLKRAVVYSTVFLTECQSCFFICQHENGKLLHRQRTEALWCVLTWKSRTSVCKVQPLLMLFLVDDLMADINSFFHCCDLSVSERLLNCIESVGCCDNSLAVLLFLICCIELHGWCVISFFFNNYPSRLARKKQKTNNIPAHTCL